MNILLLVFLLFTIFFEMDSGNKPKPFLGEWKSEWSISKNNQLVLPPSKSSVMYGLFSFDNKGALTIQGFGYPNCLFSEDTIIHNTNWFVQDDQLVIGNKEKNQFHYNIKSLDNNEITMTLFGDINLVLRK